jgi:hypothetical protein
MTYRHILRITIVQEQVEAAAPQGWTLSLDSFSLGDVAPTLTGWQVFNNSVTGEVERVTADFILDTTSLTMSLTGNGPFVGVFVGATSLRWPHRRTSLAAHWRSVDGKTNA